MPILKKILTDNQEKYRPLLERIKQNERGSSQTQHHGEETEVNLTEVFNRPIKITLQTEIPIDQMVTKSSKPTDLLNTDSNNSETKTIKSVKWVVPI